MAPIMSDVNFNRVNPTNWVPPHKDEEESEERKKKKQKEQEEQKQKQEEIEKEENSKTETETKSKTKEKSNKDTFTESKNSEKPGYTMDWVSLHKIKNSPDTEIDTQETFKKYKEDKDNS